MAIYLTPSGRVYCSETGRFLQKDHLAPRGTNSYAYPNNSPVNAVDPSGLRAVTLHFYLGGVPKYAAKFTPDMQERLRAILARCFRTCKCDTVTVVFEGPATPATRLGSNQNDIGIAINFSGEEGPLTAGGGQALAQSAHWGTSIFTNAWTKARDYQNEEPPGKTGILLPNLLAHQTPYGRDWFDTLRRRASEQRNGPHYERNSSFASRRLFRSRLRFVESAVGG